MHPYTGVAPSAPGAYSNPTPGYQQDPRISSYAGTAPPVPGTGGGYTGVLGQTPGDYAGVAPPPPPSGYMHGVSTGNYGGMVPPPPSDHGTAAGSATGYHGAAPAPPPEGKKNGLQGKLMAKLQDPKLQGKAEKILKQQAMKKFTKF